MWPASTSTATPSGMWPPVTITRRSEPSVAIVMTRPSLALRKKRRSVTPSMVVVIGNSVRWESGGAASFGGDDPARPEIVDLGGGEAELGQHLAIVLAEFRRAPGGDLVHAVYVDRAADRLVQMAAG